MIEFLAFRWSTFGFATAVFWPSAAFRTDFLDALETDVFVSEVSVIESKLAVFKGHTNPRSEPTRDHGNCQSESA